MKAFGFIWDLFQIIGDVLQIIWDIRHWRWNLCFWAGAILATISVIFIPPEPQRWIVGGVVLVAFTVAGMRWDYRATGTWLR